MTIQLCRFTKNQGGVLFICFLLFMTESCYVVMVGLVLCNQDYPELMAVCLCLPHARIIGLYHDTQLLKCFFNV